MFWLTKSSGLLVCYINLFSFLFFFKKFKSEWKRQSNNMSCRTVFWLVQLEKMYWECSRQLRFWPLLANTVTLPVTASFDMILTEGGHLPVGSSLQALLESLQWRLLASMQTHKSSHQTGSASLIPSSATRAKVRRDLNFSSFAYKAENLPVQVSWTWV